MEKKNLKKLSKSVFPMEFIEKHNAVWGDEQWKTFCQLLDDKGFTPIDFDQVGLLLEQQKVTYLAKKSNW